MGPVSGPDDDSPIAEPAPRSGPPTRVRLIGRALTTVVTRAPWLWPLLRRPMASYFDDRAIGWDERTGAPGASHLAPLAVGVTKIDRRPERALDLGTGTGVAALFLAREFPHASIRGVDISEEITRQTAVELISEYPGLRVHGVICDFENDLERLPAWGQRRMIAFLGGTIGNFPPAQRVDFLSRIARMLGPEDSLLLGTDLVKDPALLEAAYNDSAGVTARFNKNVLTVLNRELGAEFDLEAFEHRAFYDAERQWIDIRLRSLADQIVSIRGLGIEVELRDGEEIRTEISCKFTRATIEAAYEQSGLRLVEFWTDPDEQFGLSLARPG